MPTNEQFMDAICDWMEVRDEPRAQELIDDLVLMSWPPAAPALYDACIDWWEINDEEKINALVAILLALPY